MTWLHYVGALLVLGAIIAVGVSSGRSVKSSGDFTGGSQKAGVALVTGAMTGTIIGGASTIGTAQLAYTNGLSAWWFTIGAGLGALLLTGLVPRLYTCGRNTLPEIVGAEFGQRASSLMAVLSSAGIFGSVVSQLLSGVALVTAVAGLISPVLALVLVFGLIVTYVIFGGLLSAGRAGVLKTALIVGTLVICGSLVIWRMGGLAMFTNPLLTALPANVYFDFFGRGYGVEIGNCMSLLLGVSSEQAYFLALRSARSLRVSRAGVGLAAGLMPVVGGLGVLIGLDMKASGREIQPSLALPMFILDRLPALPAGMMLAALLIVVVGSAAGLCFGIATVLVRDLILPVRKNLFKKTSRISLPAWTRVVLLAVLGAAALVAFADPSALIMDWSFLALGLRACVSFFPLMAALFFPGRVHRGFALAAMVAGPGFTGLGAWLLPATIDPILPGMAAAFGCVLAGFVFQKWISAQKRLQPPVA
ncbi:MAG: hypothetical protein LBR58_04340 [Propionibacteriaceae bacterium]|nr:hypothetical protein [Propionibacteriaceae bacterium]